MLRCLMVSAEQALEFLLATHVKPFPPFEVVMDALLYLRNFHGAEIKSRTELQSRYVQILRKQREPFRWIFHMEQKHLDLLLEDCSDDERKDLLGELLNSNVDLSHHCLLTLMGFFTRIGDVESALRALDRTDIRRRQGDKHLLSRCGNLLKLDHIVHDGGSPNFRILPRILEAGVRPNLAIHNMIMKNAIRLGAYVVAWDLYRYIQDHNLPTNARTYLILMQDALARRDMEGLEEVLTAVKDREDLSTNPYLMAYTLNVIRVVHGQDLLLSPAVVFSNMLAVYSRAFSAASLIRLNLVSETSASRLGQSQVEPDATTLAYFVWAYVMAQHSSLIVQSLFERVEHLRSDGDGTALALTQCPPFYDGFLLFFARKSSTLPMCLQIVQSMLDRGVESSATTWTRLVSAFTSHGHLQAAEELRTMMARKGLRLEEKSAALRMQHQPSADPGPFPDSAIRKATEMLEGFPSDSDSALVQAAKASRCDGEEIEATMDDEPFCASHDLRQQDLPSSREDEKKHGSDLIRQSSSNSELNNNDDQIFRQAHPLHVRSQPREEQLDKTGHVARLNMSDKLCRRIPCGLNFPVGVSGSNDQASFRHGRHHVKTEVTKVKVRKVMIEKDRGAESVIRKIDSKETRSRPGFLKPNFCAENSDLGDQASTRHRSDDSLVTEAWSRAPKEPVSKHEDTKNLIRRTSSQRGQEMKSDASSALPPTRRDVAQARYFGVSLMPAKAVENSRAGSAPTSTK